MELLPNDILWLILKKVIGDYFNKEYENTYYLRYIASSKAIIVSSSEECANCSPLKKELKGLCTRCNKLYMNGYTVKASITVHSTTWTCGCCISQYKYYCGLHRYMYVKGPLGYFSNCSYGGITTFSSLELLMSQLSIVNHRFQNLVRSKCTWFDIDCKIWAFKENLLENTVVFK